jgi:heme a synthase
VIRPPANLGLFRYAVLTALASWVLICFGGLVTSHGAGLAVPDWPNTYGYNLFLFPVSKWVGGIFYEHTHRLVASAVGVMTIGLAIWLWRAGVDRRLRRLGWVAVVAVVGQGVLGGLRVVLLVDQLGIVHAALGQLFLVLVSAIALLLSPWWAHQGLPRDAAARRLRIPLVALTVLIFLQLIVGAAMRHRHAGLAIPDFPAAYGRVWPATDPDSIRQYNLLRTEVKATNPIEAWDVHLQMVHRVLALAILAGTVMNWRLVRQTMPSSRDVLGRGAGLLAVLVGAQAILGAATIWSGKAADVATAHVAVGSAVLTLATLLALVAYGKSGARVWCRSSPGQARPTPGALQGSESVA